MLWLSPVPTAAAACFFDGDDEGGDDDGGEDDGDDDDGGEDGVAVGSDSDAASRGGGEGTDSRSSNIEPMTSTLVGQSLGRGNKLGDQAPIKGTWRGVDRAG